MTHLRNPNGGESHAEEKKKFKYIIDKFREREYYKKEAIRFLSLALCLFMMNFQLFSVAVVENTSKFTLITDGGEIRPLVELTCPYGIHDMVSTDLHAEPGRSKHPRLVLSGHAL